VADLDQTAREALDTVSDLLAAADQAQARLATLRELVIQTQARLDSEWAVLRERTQAFLLRATTEASQVAVAKTGAHSALTNLRSGLDDLHGEAGRELEETQVSLHAMGTDLDQIEDGMTGVLDEADEAEELLRNRLETVQGEVAEAMAETEGLLRGALADELRQTQQEIEQEAVELAASVTGEFLAALDARSRELFEQLVETEAEIGTLLDQVSEATESTADHALRECSSGFEHELARLQDTGETLEERLEDLEEAVSDGRKRLEDRQSRWSDVVRRTREDLRDAQELKDVEVALNRFGFK
jgi:chromosome segregation ATPase